MVPMEGVEPTRPRGHWILSPARLPIPPHRRSSQTALPLCRRFLACQTLWVFGSKILTGFQRWLYSRAIGFQTAAMRVLGIVCALLTIMDLRAEVVFEGAFYSKVFQTNRFVRIYLPPSYKTAPDKHYPVLYLHDGQNVFTTAGPHAAFGWGPWNLDSTADKLVLEGKMAEIIMVATDCSSQRYQEYRGPISASTNNSAYDKYSRYLITELKPKIDREYRTLPQPENTGVMGSSMGGICSLALGWENSKTFGLVASISGAYQVEKRYFLKNVLAPYSGHP